MPHFGTRSLNNLSGVHPDLRKVMDAAIKRIDFTVIEGQRGREEQELAKARGNSHAAFGQSAHNYMPALAVDVIPYPFKSEDWNDIGKFRAIAEVVKEEAEKLNIPITWGGDWHSIKDFPHYELSNWKSIKGALAS